MSACLSVCLSVCLPACLSVHLSVCPSVCLSVCLSVPIRKYPITGEPIGQAHVPKTNTTFFIHRFTYCLGRQGNNSCFAAPRLPMDHKRILTWTFNILFNILRRKNNIKAKCVSTVNVPFMGSNKARTTPRLLSFRSLRGHLH